MGRSGAVECGCSVVNKNGTERDNRADILQFALSTWSRCEAARADSVEVAPRQIGYGIDLGSLAQGEGRSVSSGFATTTDGEVDAGRGRDAEHRFEQGCVEKVYRE